MPWIGIGALNGFFVVLLGAFGAHALKTRLSPEMLAVYETGVRYQAYHALALVGVGLWAATRPMANAAWVGGCFLLGIVLFSGSLYALALSGVRWLGAITPLGGLAFLAGWGLWTWSALRR